MRKINVTVQYSTTVTITVDDKVTDEGIRRAFECGEATQEERHWANRIALYAGEQINDKSAVITAIEASAD